MKFQFVTLILWFCAHNLSAQETVLVEDAVRLALTNNLQLQAARFSVEEASARVRDAGRLPNPELESAFAPNIAGHEYTFTVGFNQSFPITSRLKLEKRISRIEVDLARAEIGDFERSLAFQVRTTAVALATINALQTLSENQRANSRDLQETIRRGAQAGEASELDLAQLELEAGRLSLQQVQFRAARSELVGELSLLLGWRSASNLNFALPPADLKFLPVEDGIQRRNDFLAARHRAEAARQNMELARAQRWHDVKVGTFTEIDRNEDAPNGLETDHIVGVRVAIPIPLWNKGRGRIAEATAAAARAEREETALLARVQAEMDAAAMQVRAAAEQLQFIRDDLLPKARRLEERITSFHAQGLSSFLEVLRARERRLELESAVLIAERDHSLARARYLHASGTTLIDR